MAICIVVARFLQPFLHYRPAWATPFVKEIRQQGDMISPDPKKWSARGSKILLAIFLAGLLLHLVTVFYPHLNTTALAPAVSWVNDLPQSKNISNMEIRPYSSF